MAVGVDHDAMFQGAWLDEGEGGAAFDRPGDRAVQVVDADVQMHRRRLPAFDGRPLRSAVVGLVVEVQCWFGDTLGWADQRIAGLRRLARTRASSRMYGQLSSRE